MYGLPPAGCRRVTAGKALDQDARANVLYLALIIRLCENGCDLCHVKTPKIMSKRKIYWCWWSYTVVNDRVVSGADDIDEGSWVSVAL